MSGALGLALVRSHVPLVVAEGRCCRTPPGGVVTSQPAGRRIALRLWLVSGDALGERDRTHIGVEGNGVKDIIPTTARC